MPNWNNVGQDLSGLASIIKGIRGIQDPNRDQRDRLIQLLQQKPELAQQYQDNPGMAQVVAGMKPRFGSSKGYDQLQSMIQNATPSSENTREKYLRNVASYQGGETPQNVNNKLAPLFLGDSVLTNTKLPITPDLTKGYIPGMAQKKEEFLTQGKISSPEQREKERLGLKQQEAATKGELARTTIAEQTAQEKADEIKRIATARPIAQDALSRLPKNKNRYEAVLDGTISGDERNAVYAVPETYKQIQDDKQLYDEQQTQKSARQARIEAKQNSYVTQLMLEADKSGVHLSMDQATQIANTPKDKLPAQLQSTVGSVNDYFQRTQMGQAHSQFIQDKRTLEKTIQDQGGTATDADIETLNRYSAEDFGYLGLKPIVFGLKKIPSGKWYSKDKLVPIIIDGDPKLINSYKGSYPILMGEAAKPVANNQTQTGNEVDLDAFSAKLPSTGSDNEIKAQLSKIYSDPAQLDSAMKKVNALRKKNKK